MTTVQPAAKAGPSFQACINKGYQIVSWKVSYTTYTLQRITYEVPRDNLTDNTNGFVLRVSEVFVASDGTRGINNLAVDLVSP